MFSKSLESRQRDKMCIYTQYRNKVLASVNCRVVEKGEITLSTDIKEASWWC